MVITMILLTVAPFVYAQKGTGDNTGVARSSSVNEVIQISGELQKVVNETCTQTTGRYSQGTHLLIKTAEGETQPLNVHLGPTQVVSGMTDKLETGQEIQMKVFRTDNLPENQYVAKEFTSEGKSYELRDASLSPFWAGNRKGRRGMRNRQ